MKHTTTLVLLLVGIFFLSSVANGQDYRKSEIKTETIKTDTISVSENGTIETATTYRVFNKQEPIPDFTYSFKPFASLVQVSFKDWADGGVNSLAWSTGLLAKSMHKFNNMTWRNRLELKFGQTKSDNVDLRKTSDIIDFESKLNYGNSIFKPEVIATLRTQFAPGYDYDASGEPQISAFFDPAYLIQSIGLSYREHDNLDAFLGIAFREIIASTYTNFSDDPDTDEIDKVNFKTGIRASANTEFDIMEDMTFESRLQLFSAFDQLDTWDVDSRSMLRMKINSYLQTNLGLYLLFQKNASERLQIQQTIELSFNYTISNF